jgi:predicted transcriptional regulator of viral defense system
MRFSELLARARDLPVVDSKTLRTWGAEPRALSVQLSRWTRQDKLVPLRRGVYLLAPAWRRRELPAEYLANLLVVPSYVSLERALAFHGLIPESVPLVQSITLRRPMTFRTAEEDFEYRHVKKEWFFGYRETAVGSGSALIATPEKALLDLVYLSHGPFSVERVDELRLQPGDTLNPRALVRLAAGRGDRLESAARTMAAWIRRNRR